MAILQELQRLGKTIIISSHILSELQTLCNRVAIIEKGKLIYSGPVQGVRDADVRRPDLLGHLQGDSAPAMEILKSRPEVAEAVAVDGQIKVTFANHGRGPCLLPDALVQGGVQSDRLLGGRTRSGRSLPPRHPRRNAVMRFHRKRGRPDRPRRRSSQEKRASQSRRQEKTRLFPHSPAKSSSAPNAPPMGTATVPVALAGVPPAKSKQNLV